MNQQENIGLIQDEYLSIIHLDRLQITFYHQQGSVFKNFRNPDLIPVEQVYNHVRLLLDNSKGASAYHFTFIVFYNNIKVGRLHTANKLKKNDIEFDYDKVVLYSIDEHWWYEIYTALISDLGLVCNNINYVEIAVDTTKNLVDAYRNIFSNSINNRSKFNSYFELPPEVKVDVLNNGSTFNIRGTCNMISIYEKTNNAENYISNYFNLNGFEDMKVYRVEARLNWNYLKSKMYNRKILINIETLLDKKMLATLFKISVENKLTCKDLRTKYYDKNRNIKFEKVSILDDIHFDSADLLKANPELNCKHFKTEDVKSILTQVYYRYLMSGNKKYFKSIINISDAGGYDHNHTYEVIKKFNMKYKGNRTLTINQRMEFVLRHFAKKTPVSINDLFRSISLKLKWRIPGLF